MHDIDEELLDDFKQEMQEIEKELKNNVQHIINTNMELPIAFERFGQAIDRIYGTAMTIGFKEMGEYCKSLKDASYMASASENIKGKEKACRLMLECIKLFNEMMDSLQNPDKIAALGLRFNQQKGKVDILNRKEFFSVNKKSC